MIIEAIPNISEGRDKVTINAAAQIVRETPGCALLHVESDKDHNRSVLSFIGGPEGVAEASFQLAKMCVGRIDLRRHEGVHPRMGAIDVLPFVPVRGATMEDCAALARSVGERIWQELKLPVYLYEQAAELPHRKDLADVRRGQFEGLSEKMLRPEWAPDFGDCAPHPSAGAVAVGARAPLVAFNMHLDTRDVRIAKAIAKAVRASSGGLECVKALGLYLPGRDCAQVSLNMTDHTKTPLHRALELCKAEAARHGAKVTDCEIIGLAPMRALADSAIYYMQLDGFDPSQQILESRLF